MRESMKLDGEREREIGKGSGESGKSDRGGGREGCVLATSGRFANN